MTVQQVIDLANKSELKGMAVGKDVDAVLGYINLGLIELYKRFPLSTKEYIVDLLDGVTVYDLPGDCMWITAVYGEVPEGDTSGNNVNILPLNVEDNPLSVNSVSWNEIQIPSVTAGAKVGIMYVSSPEYVGEADLGTTIGVPTQMVEALLAYVGYRANQSLGGGERADDDSFYRAFEVSCNKIEQLGMYTADDMDMAARDMKGFV